MSNSAPVQEALAKLRRDKLVTSDNQFNAPSSKENHETAYTIILDAYADNIKRTLRKKCRYKTYIFGLRFLCS